MSDMHREASCFLPLADGKLQEITVVANRPEGRGEALAGIKVIDGDRTLQQQVRDVVASARLTEFGAAGGWKVAIYMEPPPAPHDSSWELAVVVADRMARGLLPTVAGRTFAMGCSQAWETGRVEALSALTQSVRLNQLGDQLQESDRLFLAQSDDPFALEQANVLIQSGADITLLTHLGGLQGQPDPARAVRRSRVWFPLVSGNHGLDRLAWAEVAVAPRSPDENQQSEAEITVTGQCPVGVARQLSDLLAQAREADSIHVQRWQTAVRFSQWDFTDNSYQLALVMADRIARGREIPAPGASCCHRLFQPLGQGQCGAGGRYESQGATVSARGDAGRPHTRPRRLAG